MVIKILQTIFFASFKYLFTLPYAMLIGLDYKVAVLSLLVGGIGGFVFFYHLYKPVFGIVDKTWNYIVSVSPGFIKPIVFSNRKKTEGLIFSKRARFLAKLKNTYGMWGIIIATPFFLSVPIGAFLMRRYYSRRKNIFIYITISFIFWAGLYSAIIFLFPNVFVQ